MSAGGTPEGRLALAMRALFAPMLSHHAGPDPAPAAPAAADAAPASEGPPVPRMLSGPAPRTAPGTGPAAWPTSARSLSGLPGQQPGFFEPPGREASSRALFLKDFTSRFHDTMRRSGVVARDPLHPVLTMLGEMLVHFTHLQADHTIIADRAADNLTGLLREESARAQATVAEQAREIARAVAQGAGRVEAAAAEVRKGREDVVRGFRADTETLLRDAITKHASRRGWRDRLIAAAVLAATAAALAGGGVWYGRSWERENMLNAIRTIKEPFLAAALRDGAAVAGQWLGLMQWNHLEQADKTCGPEPDGPNYRLVCTIILWGAPPRDAPPPRP